jgi:hypothetical protein
MPEQSPLLRIIARFDINENPSQPLGGRAYLTSCGTHAWDPLRMIIEHTPDLVYAVTTLREVIASPQLEHTRKAGYKHVVAIMWGEPRQGGEANQMIDLMLWNFNQWGENGEIATLPLRNGSQIHQAKDGSLPVTCEGGWKIVELENQYRHEYPESVFREIGPNITNNLANIKGRGIVTLNTNYDFCSSTGRERLKEILRQGTHPISINAIE